MSKKDSCQTDKTKIENFLELLEKGVLDQPPIQQIEAIENSLNVCRKVWNYALNKR